jgi:hypothetical protein
MEGMAVPRAVKKIVGIACEAASNESFQGDGSKRRRCRTQKGGSKDGEVAQGSKDTHRVPRRRGRMSQKKTTRAGD